MSLWNFPFFVHSCVKLVILVIWISPHVLISFVTDLTTEELSQEGLCPLSHHSLSFEHSNRGALLFLMPLEIWSGKKMLVQILYHTEYFYQNQNFCFSHFRNYQVQSWLVKHWEFGFEIIFKYVSTSMILCLVIHVNMSSGNDLELRIVTQKAE